MLSATKLHHTESAINNECSSSVIAVVEKHANNVRYKMIIANMPTTIRSTDCARNFFILGSRSLSYALDFTYINAMV